MGTRILVGVFQLVSFTFLAVGTLKIRRYICENNMRNEMNTRIMIFHILSLVFYVSTGLGFYISEANYYFDPDSTTEVTVLITVSICQISTFTAQMLQLAILYRLGNDYKSTRESDARSFTSIKKDLQEANEIDRKLVVQSEIEPVGDPLQSFFNSSINDPVSTFSR